MSALTTTPEYCGCLLQCRLVVQQLLLLVGIALLEVGKASCHAHG
jgi:hypothetical protein